jgi:toxin ParE1/3/4
MEHAAAAERLQRLVVDAARRIGQFPLLGRRNLMLADARYRFLSVSGFPYLIVYRPDTSPPSIVRFVHTAQDLERILADLREPPDMLET